MKNQIDPLLKSTISDEELDVVIGANKELYDRLNELPEIEALDSTIEDTNSKKGRDGETEFTLDIIAKIKSFYYENELIRYASWALILIFLSTTALTFLEYEMFYNDMISDVEGSFTFGGEIPNWVDTFFSYVLVGCSYIYNSWIWRCKSSHSLR